MPYLSVGILAVLAIFFGQSGEDVWFIIFKPLTTIAIICILIAQRTAYAKQSYWLFLAGLVACLFGDILLLNESRFVAGLCAFLIAHLLFMAFFTSLSSWSWNWLVLAVLFAIGAAYFHILTPFLGDFLIPVAVYSSVIILMAWQGVGLTLQQTSGESLLVGFGAILFMFSDAVIAYNKFVTPFELSTLVILASYWLALLCIVRGSYSVVKGKR